MLAATSTWLIPSVAMNEFTLSFTTMKPDTNPTAPHAASARSALSTCGMSVFCASAVVIAMEKPIMTPTERSNVSAMSGTRKANASIAMMARSVRTSLILVAVRNCGWVSPNTIMNAAQR